MIYVLGGSNPLNFRVLDGTTQPSNLKENDVWVNTSTKITSWDFTATEPSRRSNNKNLCVYPFYNTTKKYNGITFTDKKDGTVTANGTASSGAGFYLSDKGASSCEMILLPGTYHLSGRPNDGTSTHFLSLDYSSDDWATSKNVQDRGSGVTFTVNMVSKAKMNWYFPSGTKVSNTVLKPQLEKGSAATSFVKGDATGQVWFPVGTSSDAQFNALKKNSIQVYPLSANQYINGAWVAKEAKIYNGGKLVNFSKTPIEYQDVEYIQSTGTQYLNIGFIPDATATYRHEFKFDAQQLSSESYIMGCIESGARYNFALEDNVLRVNIGAATNNISAAITTNTVYDAIVTIAPTTVSMSLNGTSYGSKSCTVVKPPDSVYLFARRYSPADKHSKAKLYYWRIYQNDVLLREFLPCYRRSDSVAGMYDTVSKNFYVNSGSGTFIVRGNV